jgi:hypothetical protein
VEDFGSSIDLSNPDDGGDLASATAEDSKHIAIDEIMANQETRTSGTDYSGQILAGAAHLFPEYERSRTPHGVIVIDRHRVVYFPYEWNVYVAQVRE